MSESETIVNRPLGKIGGPLFCICLFITCFYGAVFLVGPALSLIYIWVCIHRVNSVKFKINGVKITSSQKDVKEPIPLQSPILYLFETRRTLSIDYFSLGFIVA